MKNVLEKLGWAKLPATKLCVPSPGQGPGGWQEPLILWNAIQVERRDRLRQ